MNILLISQCSKKAREQSCQILDQFAERKGDSTWQTAITLEGLETLRRLLRKTARRNTAVACHWIKKSGQTDLLWIVGNVKRFSVTGAVPTNRTSLNILRNQHESDWHTTETIALLAAIAGLFHDVGKAGALFQQGLLGKSSKRFQPFRHEWISLRLFQAFVGRQNDRQWIEKLGTMTAEDDDAVISTMQKDSAEWSNSPFVDLPPAARVVAWLILSHHRLPQYTGDNAPALSAESDWLNRQLNASWNARNHLGDWNDGELIKVWTFQGGTPLRSERWRDKAQQVAKRAAQAGFLSEFASLDRPFTAHLARLSLMLADHYYSSLSPIAQWQNSTCQLWANTDRLTKQPKQKLDEHNVGVAHHALLTGRALPQLRRFLPAITRHKGFRERAKNPKYRWQDLAYEKTLSLSDASQKRGFFGINMASTGCGKTFANARIMYALAPEEKGCRFTVAMGLRTLTLQTGTALRQRLGLGEDDLAVLVGSSAIRALYAQQISDESSASAEALFDAHQYVHFDGVISQGPLRHLFDSDQTLSKLVNAPLLVTTIDHLMPATEGIRGGRQIAPMLRLLTSDLVLDEPDDFDIADHHALCRLVNWTGMLGGRVLLSSATLPPALVQALFAAYCTGRQAWQQDCGDKNVPLNICCAWFDEDDARVGQYALPGDFFDAHTAFTQRRAQRLPGKPILRRARLINTEPPALNTDAVIASLSTSLHREMINLHNVHHQQREDGTTLSLGLVRIANINPLVALAQALMRIPSPDGYSVHYCVYHSQYPLGVRAHMERQLDAAFMRQDENALWQHPTVQKALRKNGVKHHLFVVLATSVVEVGRDWDADWGIIEPSSMRSLIQFAGRIQRHRQHLPLQANMLILNKNIRALRTRHHNCAVYCQPGFESSRFLLSSHDLNTLLTPEEYTCINALPRILDRRASFQPGKPFDSLITLEHMRLWEDLLGKGKEHPVAAHWWRLPVNWSGEMQRRTPFRQSQPESQYFLFMADESDTPVFMQRDEGSAGRKESGLFTRVELHLASGVEMWMDSDYADVLRTLADEMDRELSWISERFGEINLRTQDGGWLWHPQLGVFRVLD